MSGNASPCPRQHLVQVPRWTDAKVPRLATLRAVYDWAAKPLRELCRLNPPLADFLLEAPPHTRHYIALALAGRGQSAGLDEASLAIALPSSSRRRLLASLWGRDLGSTRILMRLDPNIYEEAIYARLAGILGSAAKRQALADIRQIEDRQIHRIAEASDETIKTYRGRLIGTFGEPGIGFLIDGLLRVRPDLSRQELQAALNRLEKPSRIDRFLSRITRDLPLPPPPWQGTETIRALRSVADLRATGIRLENCLNGLFIWSEALSGQRAFYLVEERELCVVALARHSVFDTWFLHSLAKRRNGIPAPDIRQRIVSVFRDAGFPYFDGAPIGTGLSGDL